MTCIVGIVDPRGHVMLAGDSAGVSGYDVTPRRDAKVFRVGEFVMGYTSSFRMGQLLRFGITPPEPVPGIDPFEYMVRAFIPEARRVFGDGGFRRRENEVESGGSFLVGFRGRLFSIGEDFQVGESCYQFDAVGCGASYALGALLNLRGSTRSQLLAAIETADEFSGGVCAPYLYADTRAKADSWPRVLE